MNARYPTGLLDFWEEKNIIYLLCTYESNYIGDRASTIKKEN